MKVQVISVTKEALPVFGDKKTTLVKAQVGDETAKADLFWRTETPDIIKEGKVIAIRNGRRQIVKGHISFQLDIFGRITEEKDEIKATGELNISEKELPKRENRERRNDDRERRPERRERTERGERAERREEGGERRRNEVRRDRDYDRNYDRDYERRPRRDEREGGHKEARNERSDRRDNRDNRDYRRD